MTAETIKNKIIEIVKREYHSGMINVFEGNISARLGDRIFITPSQVSKEFMTAKMLIEMDMGGNVIASPSGTKPSSEYRMHLEVYRLRPDIKAVVHNHSTYATAYALCNMPIDDRTLPEMNFTFGVVPVIPYGTPGTEAIYAGFADEIEGRSAFILGNHGVITFAQDLEMAHGYAEAVEKIAKTLFVSRLLGTPVTLPDSEIDGLRSAGAAKRKAACEASLRCAEQNNG